MVKQTRQTPSRVTIVTTTRQLTHHTPPGTQRLMISPKVLTESIQRPPIPCRHSLWLRLRWYLFIEEEDDWICSVVPTAVRDKQGRKEEGSVNLSVLLKLQEQLIMPWKTKYNTHSTVHSCSVCSLQSLQER